MNRHIHSIRKFKSPMMLREAVGILLAVLVCCGTAQPEVCPGSKVKKADLVKFDQHLVLPQNEINAAIAKHLPWGSPECAKVLVLREYIVCYDAQRRIPSWAS